MVLKSNKQTHKFYQFWLAGTFSLQRMFSIFDGIALFLIIVPLNINAFAKLANLGANSKYKLSKDNMLLYLYQI